HRRRHRRRLGGHRPGGRGGGGANRRLTHRRPRRDRRRHGRHTFLHRPLHLRRRELPDHRQRGRVLHRAAGLLHRRREPYRGLADRPARRGDPGTQRPQRPPTRPRRPQQGADPHMNLLVTGAAGFIRSRYVRSLLAADAPVAPRINALDALTYPGTLDNLGLDHPRLEFVQGDIRDAELVGKLTAEADHVVHFAAESHVDRSILTASDFVLTNVVGTQVLLDAALRHGVGTFVHVSTDEVYGSIASGSATEEYPLEPSSPYSASKAS